MLSHGNQHHPAHSPPCSPTGRIARIEHEFASVVRDFLARVDPRERPVCTHICKRWAGDWAAMTFGFWPASPGTDEFKAEALRSYRRAAWRKAYLANREKILERQRLRRAQRKGAEGANSQTNG